MKLTSAQALALLQAPANKREINSAKRVESQLRVFTEEQEQAELVKEPYWTKLLETIKTRTPTKAERVLQFARYPLPVVPICDSILTDFFKVFDGKNRNFNVDSDREITTLKLWVDEVNVEKWVEDTAREVFKNKPCSFVVMDADETGKPYMIHVDSDRLIDAGFKDKGSKLDYIVFIHSENTDAAGNTVCNYAVYDDATYFVFSKTEAGEFSLISEHPHQIGYTPAIPFISQTSNSKNYFKRRVAFSASLANLEDWVIFDVFRNYLDHYAPFPVTEAPAKECPNPDCSNGYITTEVINEEKPGDVIIKHHKCETCAGDTGQYIGPGTHIGIDVARSREEVDGSGVFRMVFPDTDKLAYVPEKLDDLEIEIRYKTVGINQMDSSNEALNELQVKGSFAGMETVLVRTKKELDHVYKWIVATAGRLMYKNIELSIDANFGTEFYLLTEAELQERYAEAQKAGLRDEMVMIYLQIIDTKYKGNPAKVKRQKMLLQLDPLPLYSVSESINMKTTGIIDLATLTLKINFTTFVQRFENENGPITQFGRLLEPAEVIRIIQAELQQYNTEWMENHKPEPVEPKTIQ